MRFSSLIGRHRGTGATSLAEGYSRALVRSAEAFRKALYSNRLAVMGRPGFQPVELDVLGLERCLRMHQEEIGEIEFDPAWGGRRYAPLFRALEHAFRNALDHGLDSPHSQILIQFSLVGPGATHQWLKITVTDKGRGIDPEMVRRRLRSRGKGTLAATSSEPALLDLLMDEPGSGLYRVRRAAKTLGGTAKLFSSPGKGTQVIVMVPYGED